MAYLYKILEKKEALDTNYKFKAVDFDNTLVKQSSGLELFKKRLFELNDKEIINKFSAEVKNYFLYKIKLRDEEAFIKKSVEQLEGCNINLIDLVVKELQLRENVFNKLKNSLVRIVSKTDEDIIARYLEQNSQTFKELYHPIEIVANKLEKKDGMYTGNVEVKVTKDKSKYVGNNKLIENWHFIY